MLPRTHIHTHTHTQKGSSGTYTNLWQWIHVGYSVLGAPLVIQQTHRSRTNHNHTYGHTHVRTPLRPHTNHHDAYGFVHAAKPVRGSISIISPLSNGTRKAHCCSVVTAGWTHSFYFVFTQNTTDKRTCKGCVGASMFEWLYIAFPVYVCEWEEKGWKNIFALFLCLWVLACIRGMSVCVCVCVCGEERGRWREKEALFSVVSAFDQCPCACVCVACVCVCVCVRANPWCLGGRMKHCASIRDSQNTHYPSLLFLYSPSQSPSPPLTTIPYHSHFKGYSCRAALSSCIAAL